MPAAGELPPIDSVEWGAADGPRFAGRLRTAGGDVPVLAARGAEPGPTLALVAGVHGDEVACIRGLEDSVRATSPRAGTLVAIPCAHPAALAAGTRRGPDGVDLNRAFPGDRRGSATERLAASLLAALSSGVDAVVTLHSWSREGTTVPYVEYPDGGGDAAEASRSLAMALGLPFAEAWEWPAGMLPAVLVDGGVPAVEVEIGGLGVATEADARLVGEVGRAAARHLRLLEGPKPGSRRTRSVRREEVRTPAEGRIVHRLEPGDAVSRGDVVAEIRDLHGRTVAELEAPVSGVVAIQVSSGWARPEEPVAVLFRSPAGDRPPR